MRYEGIRVFKAGWLINIISSERSRGMALGWFILIREPDLNGYVWSTTGRKTLKRLLAHEYVHIQRQQELGVFKWLWKYFTDKEFVKEEERIAIDGEV